MGKRKSSKKAPTRAKAKPLDKVFRCLFCQHVGSVLCKMDRQNRIGRLDCKDCMQSFQAAITPLDEPVDLYSLWIDACEAVNTPAATSTSTARARPAVKAARRAQGSDDEDDEEAEEEEDDDEDLPDAPGGAAAASRKKASNSSRREADDDDDDDEEDADASADVDPSDRGYERQPVNAKLQSLIQQKKARAAVEDDEDDE